MKTFPHPEVTKEIMVADMIAHRKADELVAGVYGKGVDGKFQGCAVGCSIHTINRLRGTTYSYGDHAALAAEIGAPLALVQLQDRVFERLPTADRTAWPERFYRAMPEGVDLSPAEPRILIRLLREIALPSVAADEWGVRDAVVEVCAAIESGDKKRIHAAAHAAHAANAAAHAAAHAAYPANAAAHAGTYAAVHAGTYAAVHAVHAIHAAAYTAHAAAHAGAYAAAHAGAYAANAAAHAGAYAADHRGAQAASNVYVAFAQSKGAAWRQTADIICEEMERCGEGWVR